ncbi:MAG: SpoIIE family protein phosphatase [Planctomycetes bacterium]|nr:SpoIIE family protein phosphatase [Planctomycetota bacterium]
MADPRAPTSRAATAAGDAKKLADLHALLEVSCQLGANSELSPLLQTIEQATLLVLDCERTTIFLYDRQSDELYSRVATGEGDIRFSAGRGIAGEAFRTQGVINVPDAYADARFNREVDRQTGFTTRNLLTCPLLGIDRRAVGVLQVLNKRDGSFDSWDEELVRTFGAQAGVAVQRQLLMDEYVEKQRLKEDLRIAHDIQQGLLPRQPPHVPNYDIAGWNRPTDETGGDFYDFQLLGSGTLAVTIADVTGHGVGPALIAAECRALLRASLSLTQNLERVLALVNDLLNTDLPDDRFVTAFVGLLEPAEHEFTYISAGHGPLFHFIAATDEIHELPTSGLPLGILPGRAYALSRPATFGHGDMLVFLTDGFIEWPDPARNRFGIEGVQTLIRKHKELSAAALIEEVYREVRRFARGTPQQDDLTAVVIKRT